MTVGESKFSTGSLRPWSVRTNRERICLQQPACLLAFPGGAVLARVGSDRSGVQLGHEVPRAQGVPGARQL